MTDGSINPPIHWSHDDHPEGVTVDDLLAAYDAGTTIYYGKARYRVVRVVRSEGEWIAKLAPVTVSHA